MSAQQAMLRLMACGFCARDAYDLLADAGFDPHPAAEPVEISERRLCAEALEWLGKADGVVGLGQ
jgi:hypothetical protein